VEHEVQEQRPLQPDGHSTCGETKSSALERPATFIGVLKRMWGKFVVEIRDSTRARAPVCGWAPSGASRGGEPGATS